MTALSTLSSYFGSCISLSSRRWGQVFILDSLSAYSTTSEFESKTIIERVLPRLQHVNCAVVISATRVILKHMKVRSSIFLDILLSKIFKICREEDLGESYILSKLAPPLITLLKAEYEIQFVALQNITFISKFYPEFLRNDIKVPKNYLILSWYDHKRSFL